LFVAQSPNQLKLPSHLNNVRQNESFVENFHESIVKHNELLIVKATIIEKRATVNIEDCFNFQQVGDIISMP